MKFGLIALVLLLAAAFLYVRLAPLNAQSYNDMGKPRPPGDYPDIGGFTVVRDLGADASAAMERLDATIRATPRTKRAAGSVAEGVVTYVTRSRLWGFPDYTTVSLQDAHITIHGRLRFGRSDLGVNRARILGWLRETDGFSGP